MSHRIRPHHVVLVAAALYTLLLGAACHVKLRAYGYDDFDLAHHTQTLHNILRGSLDCSILGIPFLGNHMVPILYLVAPLYLALPSPLLLLYLQTLVLAAGAWGVYRLACVFCPPRWAAALAVVYLLYPPLILMNLYEFHPVVFCSGLLAFALDAFYRRRFGRTLFFLGLALACQENLALIVAAFGIYAAVNGRGGRWIAVPLALGAAWFVLSVFVVMPLLNRDTIQFEQLYRHLGDSLPDVFRTLVLHPAAALRASWHPAKLRFLNLLLAPLGYLSLLGPGAFVPLLPVLAQRLLSARVSETQILYHYQAEFIPFLFAAAAIGLGRLLTLRRPVVRPLAAGLLGLMPLAAFLTSGPVPALCQALSPPQPGFPGPVADALVKAIPTEAPVTATFQFLPPLSNRTRLYSLHHVYSGRYTLSDKPYPLPAGLDWIVLNTMDRMTFQARPCYAPDRYRRLQDLLAQGPRYVAANAEGLLALSADPTAGPPAGSLLAPARPDLIPPGPVRQLRGADIRLRGFRLDEPGAYSVRPLVLFWEKHRDTGGDYDALLTLRAGDTLLYNGELAPGSRIFPPQSWPAGVVLADRHGVVLLQEPPPAASLNLTADLFRLNR
ncbi:MAG: DUF2079 domain-containing protein [Lentisphaerae bacterium]|nr:DUF2079 domain-containing protein [Lentisphaerota bacterium]